MLQLALASLVVGPLKIGALNQQISLFLERGKRGDTLGFPQQPFDVLRAVVGDFRDVCKASSMEVCWHHAADISSLLDLAPQKDGSYWFDWKRMHDVKRVCSALTESFPKEAGSKVALALSADEARLYGIADGAPFGVQAATKFPIIAEEIAEGCKCLALARSTAAAFHFIRCLEAGITALSRGLGIPDPIKGNQRNWGIVLDSIDKKIKARWTGSLLDPDRTFFEQAHATLTAMRNPYRNTTMHLDQMYTPEEARHIMNLVEGFMRSLALRLDQDGNLT